MEHSGVSQGNTTGLPMEIGGYRDDEVRQLRREFQQRLMDAEEFTLGPDRSTTRMENRTR